MGGCWVGIVIGALFLLPAVVGLVLLMAWFVRGWCRACAHVVDTTCNPCCSTAQAGCPPMGHGDADIEKSEGKQPTRSYPMQAGLTPLTACRAFCDHDIDELCRTVRRCMQKNRW